MHIYFIKPCIYAVSLKKSVVSILRALYCVTLLSEKLSIIIKACLKPEKTWRSAWGQAWGSFILSITLIPFYVALTTHHYQMLPLQTLFVLVESRSKLPFTPFWEAFIMLIFIEIIKEASLRMPTKTGQTLGVIGGIVIGQAAVEAGMASQVLIVMVGISTIGSFLFPNYLVTKANSLIQFILLVFSSFLGIVGIVLALIIVLAHLNGLSSLKQPYLSPVAPFYGKDWLDLFIRGPLTKIKERPEHLKPLKMKRYQTRR